MGILFGGQIEYVKSLAPVFALSLFLFIFSTFMGYSMGEDIPASVFEGVLSNIPDPTESTSLEMFTAILSNNLLASFLFLASGIVVGIPPLMFIIVNGFFVGWVSYSVVPPLMFIIVNGFFVGWVSYSVASELGLGFVVSTLLPHGIIEIPAITLCAAMGVGLGYQLINRLRRIGGLQRYVQDSLSLFVKRIVPLLIVAAVIETALIAVYV